MALRTVQVGNIGVTFTATVKDQDGNAIDVSSASPLQLRFKSPSKAVKRQTASFVTDGTNGQIKYTTAAATDIDVAGTWSYQAHAVIASSTLKSEVKTFQAADNVD